MPSTWRRSMATSPAIASSCAGSGIEKRSLTLRSDCRSAVIRGRNTLGRFRHCGTARPRAAGLEAKRAKLHFSSRRRDQRRDHHHHDHGREHALIDHGVAADDSVRPMLAKIRPTSPRGIMPMPTDSRSKPRPTTPSAHTCLPTMAATRQRRRQPEHARLREDAQIGAHAHQHEEDRHQERRDGLDQLLERVLAAIGEVAVVHVFQDQAGREGADDGREPDGAREPGEERSRTPADREQHAPAFSLEASEKSRGERYTPSTSAPTRNSAALPTTRPMRRTRAPPP